MKVIVRWCADKFGYYVVFHKSLVFPLGLLFSSRLVEKLFFGILIYYLIPPSIDYDLRIVTIVVNLRGGISSVLSIFLDVVALYVGLFNMLLFSSTLCIAGLVLIHFAATPNEDIAHPEMFYPALVVLTLSEAATTVWKNSFLSEEMVAIDQPTTPHQETRTEARAEFWSCIVSICATIFTLFGPLKDLALTNLARVLAVIMATAVFSLLGFKFYAHVKLSHTALRDVHAVICNGIINKRLVYPQASDQLHQNSSTDHLQIPPPISWLRWLNKAAVEQENRSGRISSTVEQVKGVKFLMKMLPMWSTFITFSLVFASGDTFFLEEASTLTEEIFPILLLTIFQKYTAAIVSEISDYVVEKLCEKKKYNPQKMRLVRIGMGMVCCVLCCVAAWSQAVHRLHIVATYGHEAEASKYMSVYRLTPQFLLLAFMDGLSLYGVKDFFEFEVCRYGHLFEECAVGSGKFVCIGFILVFSKWFAWFGRDVERSRVDKYYVILAVLNSVNIIVYCFVARWYRDNACVVEIVEQHTTTTTSSSAQ